MTGRLLTLNRKLELGLSQRRALDKQIQEGEDELERLETMKEHLAETNRLIQAAAVLTQEELDRRLSELVRSSLKVIFGEEYDFHVVFEESYGRSEGHLVLTKNGKMIYPMDGSGGGVVDIIAFALRLSLWKAQGKDIADCFWFDEPFRFLSKDLHHRLARFLTEVSQSLGVQFNFITHEDEFIEYADKGFLVVNGKVREME